MIETTPRGDHARTGRPVATIVWAIALTGLSLTGAHAQTAPIAGVQSMGPMSPIPQLPPSDLAPAPKSSSGPSDAPLASSTQACQSDVARLSGQRLAAIKSLNAIAKTNKGKLDPVAACPKFRTLVKIETEFRDYLVKNKDWCGVPDQVLETVRQSTSKDSAFSAKACALAVQFRKAQQQAAAGLAAQAPKLPAGPL